MRPIRFTSTLLPTLLLTTTLALANSWQTGKLIDTEKQEVPTGSTTTYNTDANAKNGKYSQNSTAHTTDNTDTYQVFTIETPTRTYIKANRVEYPRQKRACST